jgi:hypothetical protein
VSNEDRLFRFVTALESAARLYRIEKGAVERGRSVWSAENLSNSAPWDSRNNPIINDAL